METIDIKTLNEILDRQGSRLILGVLAEKVGEACLRYSFSGIERERLKNSLLNDLRDLINERI
jgi:hypothetical protein